MPSVVDGSYLSDMLAAGFLGPVCVMMTRDVARCCPLLAIVNTGGEMGLGLKRSLARSRLWGTRLAMLGYD